MEDKDRKTEDLAEVTPTQPGDAPGMLTEANYSAIFNSANDAIFVHDIESGKILDVNEKTCEMFCYPKEELLKLDVGSISAAVPPYTMDDAIRHMHDAADGTPQIFEWLAKDKAQRLFWVEVNIKRAVIGGRYRLLAIVRDIDERKRTEERLDEINKVFLNFTADPVENINALTALAGKLLRADCAIYNRLEGDFLFACGRWNTPEDFQVRDKAEGHMCTDLIRASNDQITVVPNLQDTEYAKTDPNVTKYNLKTYVGCPVKFEGNFIGSLCAVYQYDFIPDEEDKRVMSIIASAIGVEEERRQSEELAHLSHFSIEKASDEIFWVDKEANILYVNEMTCKSLGYSREELMAMTVHDIDPRFSKSRWPAHWDELKERGSFTFESEQRRKDGSSFPVEISVNYLEFEGNGYNFAFARDITARKKQEGELLRREEQLEILSRTNQHVNAILEEPIILRTLVAAAMELVDTSGGTAGILQKNGMLFSEYNEGGMVRAINMEFRPEHGIYSWLAESKKPYISNDAANDPKILPVKKKDFNLYNLINVPILDAKADLIGCLEMHNKKEHRPFDAQDVFMLQGLAASAAIALENARTIKELKDTEEALRESEEKYRRIIENTNDVIMLTNPNGVISYLSPACKEVFGYSPEDLMDKDAWIVHEEDNSRVRRAFSSAFKGKPGNNLEYKIVTKNGATRWVSHSWSVISNGKKPHLIVSIIRDITERKVAEKERDVLNREIMKSNRRLKQLAMKDVQTGLYNHHYLSEIIESEFYRARRYAHPLSIVMLDIDYFKSINDVYGIEFGDLILKQLAAFLRKTVRKYDIVTRYGGEEFVVVSPGVDKPRALIMSQRLLDAINIYNFGDRKNVVRLKVSVAVSTYPDGKIFKGMDLISAGEKLLQKAKQSGGNRVFSLIDLKKPGMERIEETIDTTDVRALKEKIEKLTMRGKQNLIESIFAFAKTLEIKDHYTGEHVESTVRYATAIAKDLELSEDEIENVRQASVLHDLGKIGVSDKILHKRSKLTKKEFEQIKKHPQIAADIIRPIQFLHDIIPLILYHHERWDGKGYPAGLKGDEIPMGARIISVSDVYQALTSNRPYRKAYSKKEAIKIIKEGSGTQFDPRIVKTFLKVLKREERQA
jgi:diguanylate cyclase (GGDEF)-like protein/PAS domain S-box-containing protein